jgi:hypothetical protein
MLRHRSDLEYFKYEEQYQGYMEQIKRLELQCSENDSSASNQELKRVIAESHNLKKPKVWVL